MLGLLIIITTASAIAQDTLIDDQPNTGLIKSSNQFDLTENIAENHPEFENDLFSIS